MKHILIIGGGAAGLSAAAAAAERGAKVTVLEKRKVLQGNGRYAEGVFGAGSYMQKRRNIDADPEKLFRQAMEYSHWRSDARLTRRLIDESGKTVDWLQSLGVGFNRILHHMPNQSPEVFHMAYPSPTGAKVMGALEARCRELNAELFVNANVTALTKENGRITGAEAEIDGESRKFTADCVLIATGGFSGNPELMKEMIPNCDPEKFFHLRGIPMSGEVLKLAWAAGADKVKDIAIEGCGPVFGGRPEINTLLQRSDCLWINALGMRFCDESICEDFVYGQNAVARQPGKMCWGIVDTAGIARCQKALPHMMVHPDNDDNGMSGLCYAIEKELAKGSMFKADSLEELAKAIGVPENVFLREIEEYNAGCRCGYDRIFGKDRKNLAPIESAPFYAVRAGMDMLATHGGIRINEAMEVLDANFSVISGLYAAGIDTSGVDSGDYSVMMSGHAFGFSLTGGRIAAEEMTKE